VNDDHYEMHTACEQGGRERESEVKDEGGERGEKRMKREA